MKKEMAVFAFGLFTLACLQFAQGQQTAKAARIGYVSASAFAPVLV
jgi:hypothetical protein